MFRIAPTGALETRGAKVVIWTLVAAGFAGALLRALPMGVVVAVGFFLLMLVLTVVHRGGGTRGL